MNALEFSTLLREWRHQCGYTDPQCAAALGIATGTFCRWKNYRLPDELIVSGIAHRVRHGDDPAPVCTGPELAMKVKDWRARHGLSQPEASHALGLRRHAVRDLERARNPVDSLHVIRAAELLRRMQREPDVAGAKRACAPVLVEAIQQRETKTLSACLRVFIRVNRQSWLLLDTETTGFSDAAAHARSSRPGAGRVRERGTCRF